MATLRDLPGIDRLLNTAEISPLARQFGPGRVKQTLRRMQQQWRDSGDAPLWAADPGEYAQRVAAELRTQGYQPVFNLTGTIIHTNLGRALLSPETFRAVEPLVTRPVNLEFDLNTGRRGDRDGIVEEKLKLLTGAEAATVVNNGAAALMLVLNSLALNRSVPVSRGELIEIGGSFRLPDIMERSGCELNEVGTTNRTHLADFETAINSSTGLLLKVHPSNYHVQGFTRAVPVTELATLAHDHDLPLCVDLGSGALVNLERWGLPHEPTPQESLEAGVDLVAFSGDKLLGGPQAGIIVGSAEHIARLRKCPLCRALRVDKTTLAALEATLRLYRDPEQATRQVPTLRMLSAKVAELEARSDALVAELEREGVPAESESCLSVVGGGTYPGVEIPSRGVRVRLGDSGAQAVANALRRQAPAVVGRVDGDGLHLDMRTVLPGQDRPLLAALLAVLTAPA